MSRRAILVLSGALSAFVLLIAGAAASYGLRTPSGPAAPASPPSTVAAATDSIPADVVRAREAEYRRLIDEANARLRAAPAPESVLAAPTVRGHEEREESHERRHHDRRNTHQEDDDG